MPLSPYSIGSRADMPAFQNESSILSGGNPAGVLVAVGVSVAFRSLTKGVTWQAVPIPAFTFRGVCFNPSNKKFFACATGGADRIASAPSGGTPFTAIVGSGANAQYKSIAANRTGTIVAVGDDVVPNQFLRSTDNGLTWAPVAAPAARLWTYVLWDTFNNQFIAANTTVASAIATSPDGLVWTLRVTPGAVHITGLCQSAATGRILGVDGLGGTAAWSDNGIAWNAVAITPVSTPECAAHGQIFSTLFPGTLAGPFRSTNNAVAWGSPVVLPVNKNFQAMCYAPAARRFVSVAQNTGVITSADDALTWQVGTIAASDLRSVCEGGG